MSGGRRDASAARSPLARAALGVLLAGTLAAAPAGGAQEGVAPGATGGGLDLEPSDLAGLTARALGPAVTSGRIAALDAVRDGTLTIWAGTASGGVWKSTDGGVTFEPVFDDHFQSIGAVTVDPSDPDTVWVGTGESWVRNSVSVGGGVFRTTDGGDSWEARGLADSERIARIRVHPGEPDTVWACATGHLWNANEERGVFKTTDGGGSWEKVLFVDADTGCADLAADPQDPDVLYAAMWQFRRQPDFFTSGGPGSGLWRSRDGGATWQELENGLPAGDKGRIAVAVAPSRPGRVYATVESADTALYRSDTLGESWERVNDSFTVTGRPFYFSLLVVDPEDPDTVYKPGFALGVSTDGGESFTSPFTGGDGGVHSDHHALWIDPEDRDLLVLGTDGGVYVSYDRGHAFRHVRSLPVSQVYRLSVDDRVPYNVYVGLQDNGSWMAPSRAPGGVGNDEWTNVGYGDGFWAFRDPADPDYVYSEYQGAEIKRLHLPTHEFRDVKPYPAAGDPAYRFNWNSPIAFSPHEPGTIYLGAQKLLRSRDRGESWQEISPDLTTDDPARQRQQESGGLTIDNSTAENHTTIYAVDESPVEAGVLWVGTDDGRLHVSRDGGGSWSDVTGNVPGLPAGTWVSSVEASHHAAGTAYAAFDGHRTGDKALYAYRTTDHGATWTSLADDEVEGFARALREDPFEPDLLYLGTEHGLWVSLDGGRDWTRFEGGLPKKVAVHDVVVHPRTGDLVIGTHGRGVWIVDDPTPLRRLDTGMLDAPVTLLPTRPAEIFAGGGIQDFAGSGEFTAPNPQDAAWIAYYQPKRHLFGDLEAEIYDAEGELITTVSGSKRKGLTRIAWPMRLPPPKVAPATALVPAFQGPQVPEGVYTVKLIKGRDTVEGTIEIQADPRSVHPAEDRRLQQATALDLYRQIERLTYLVDAALEARDAARERVAGLGERHRARRAAETWAGELDALRSGIVATSEAGMLSGEKKLREDLGALYGAVVGYTGRPTASQLRQAETLRGRLEEAEARFAELAAGAAEVDRLLERAGLEPVEVLGRDAWEARSETGGTGTSALALARPVKPKGFFPTLIHELTLAPAVRLR
jgi:photosystem II stability/assembly factor-like uncharacterized protein